MLTDFRNKIHYEGRVDDKKVTMTQTSRLTAAVISFQ